MNYQKILEQIKSDPHSEIEKFVQEGSISDIEMFIVSSIDSIDSNKELIIILLQVLSDYQLQLSGNKALDALTILLYNPDEKLVEASTNALNRCGPYAKAAFSKAMSG